jgi:thiosulfate dehydrogenase
MEENQPQINDRLLKVIQKLTTLLVILLIFIALSPLIYSYGDDLGRIFARMFDIKENHIDTSTKSADTVEYWSAPDPGSISDPEKKKLVEYGQELIAHTSIYLGPNGSVAQMTNGMNCQNCHLDAGTRVFGNNYGSVASTYPKFRARSGSNEDIYKRVNDCFERSLNGKPLDTLSREMQAIKSYIEFLGSNVEKGTTAYGSGLKELAFLDRACDPAKGKDVYIAKCQSCHQADGSGQAKDGINEYLYPPLWGENSYNEGAGLYRISNFARYVKYNMPLGATHANPQLTDEEAWDLAAFVNSQPHPKAHFPADWPDVSKKPVDHPFGPYTDGFTEEQHKYGPFKPIVEHRKLPAAAAQNPKKP